MVCNKFVINLYTLFENYLGILWPLEEEKDIMATRARK